MQPLNSGLEEAVRSARAAPQIKVADIAAAAGIIDEGALVDALRALPSRSRCAQIAADAATMRVAHPGPRAAGLAHPACPRGVIRSHSANPDFEVRHAPRGTTAAWAGRHSGQDLPAEAPRAAMVRQATSKRWFESLNATRLRASPLALVRLVGSAGTATTAANPACGAAGLHACAASPDEEIRAAAASNPSTPAAIVATLCEDSAYEVLRGVAANPGADIETLRRVGALCDVFVRQAVAGHPGCDEQTLTAFAGDDTNFVREAAAASPNCSAEILIALAGDAESQVRVAVAGNPFCPSETLRALSDDPVFRVRVAAAGNPHGNPLRFIADMGDDALMKALTSNAAESDLRAAAANAAGAAIGAASSDPELLETILNTSGFAPACELALAGVAADVACPAAVLDTLARDPSALVREAAASNPNIRPRRLAALTADTEANVCERAIDTIRRRSQPKSRLSAVSARND